MPVVSGIVHNGRHAVFPVVCDRAAAGRYLVQTVVDLDEESFVKYHDKLSLFKVIKSVTK